MKRYMMALLSGAALFTACNQNPENGGEEVRGNEQRSDTPISTGNYANDGISDTSAGVRTNKGTFDDSQKTKNSPLYKGDNSDTYKMKK